MPDDDDERDGAYYLLDGAAVRLDPSRGLLTPAGERVDCVAWMNRAVSVGREQYLAAASALATAASFVGGGVAGEADGDCNGRATRGEPS